RKQAEEKLRRNEQHLRRVLDSLYSFIGVLSPEGILLEANLTALQAANLQPEDVLGKPFAEAYWWSYSTASQVRLNAAIERAKTGEAVRYDVEVRLSEENYIIIDFALVPLFDAGGEIEYIIPSGIDISDREKSKQALQQSEYELRLITEIIPQQIWTATPEGEIDYINQRWQEYTGVTLEQIQADGWATVVHPDDLARIRKTWNRAVESGKKYNIEARLRGIGGKYNWFLARARPLRNERGDIIKWYGTNTNINRIKELEERLRQQTEDLIQANQLKDEFLAIVSHELRTPLNPILGWAQMLAAGRLDAEKTAMGIEIIGRNARLQAQLIEDLLDVSRILRGQLNLNKNPLNLESIIRSALTTTNLAAEAKSIQIETIYESNTLQVLGDPGRLQQVVWNLVSNAIKFTPEGGRVIIKLERVNSYAQIVVKDTGQGIKPEFLPYVFDRFSQAQSNSTRQYGGLGLGLAIVRHLTELHRGTVAVSSPGEGQGATFSVKLPLINVPATEQTEVDSNLIDQSVQPNRFSGVKVLVVDDEPDSLDIITLVLEQEGAEVMPVTSAKEALEAFNRSTPDLIISDIGMPETDGYTLITQIRALPQGKNLPAIALTAYAREIDIQRTFDAGYQKHLAKPIDIPELITTIVQLIQQTNVER
ncbi:MAG: ATP-binding protein, partial [Cyanobacteria bacterium J06631_6]